MKLRLKLIKIKLSKVTLLIQCCFPATKQLAITHMFIYKADVRIIHFINLLVCEDLMGKIYISVILEYSCLNFPF